MANGLIMALRHDRPPGDFIVLQIIRDRDFPFVDPDAACKAHRIMENVDHNLVGDPPQFVTTKTPVYKAVWWVPIEFPEEARDG